MKKMSLSEFRSYILIIHFFSYLIIGISNLHSECLEILPEDELKERFLETVSDEAWTRGWNRKFKDIWDDSDYEAIKLFVENNYQNFKLLSDYGIIVLPENLSSLTSDENIKVKDIVLLIHRAQIGSNKLYSILDGIDPDFMDKSDAELKDILRLTGEFIRGNGQDINSLSAEKLQDLKAQIKFLDTDVNEILSRGDNERVFPDSSSEGLKYKNVKKYYSEKVKAIKDMSKLKEISTDIGSLMDAMGLSKNPSLEEIKRLSTEQINKLFRTMAGELSLLTNRVTKLNPDLDFDLYSIKDRTYFIVKLISESQYPLVRKTLKDLLDRLDLRKVDLKGYKFEIGKDGKKKFKLPLDHHPRIYEIQEERRPTLFEREASYLKYRQSTKISDLPPNAKTSFLTKYQMVKRFYEKLKDKNLVDSQDQYNFSLESIDENSSIRDSGIKMTRAEIAIKKFKKRFLELDGDLFLLHFQSGIYEGEDGALTLSEDLIDSISAGTDDNDFYEELNKEEFFKKFAKNHTKNLAVKTYSSIFGGVLENTSLQALDAIIDRIGGFQNPKTFAQEITSQLKTQAIFTLLPAIKTGLITAAENAGAGAGLRAFRSSLGSNIAGQVWMYIVNKAEQGIVGLEGKPKSKALLFGQFLQHEAFQVISGAGADIIGAFLIGEESNPAIGGIVMVLSDLAWKSIFFTPDRMLIKTKIDTKSESELNCFLLLKPKLSNSRDVYLTSSQRSIIQTVIDLELNNLVTREKAKIVNFSDRLIRAFSMQISDFNNLSTKYKLRFLYSLNNTENEGETKIREIYAKYFYTDIIRSGSGARIIDVYKKEANGEYKYAGLSRIKKDRLASPMDKCHMMSAVALYDGYVTITDGEKAKLDRNLEFLSTAIGNLKQINTYEYQNTAAYYGGDLPPAPGSDTETETESTNIYPHIDGKITETKIMMQLLAGGMSSDVANNLIRSAYQKLGLGAYYLEKHPQKNIPPSDRVIDINGNPVDTNKSYYLYSSNHVNNRLKIMEKRVNVEGDNEPDEYIYYIVANSMVGEPWPIENLKSQSRYDSGTVPKDVYSNQGDFVIKFITDSRFLRKRDRFEIQSKRSPSHLVGNSRLKYTMDETNYHLGKYQVVDKDFIFDNSSSSDPRLYKIINMLNERIPAVGQNFDMTPDTYPLVIETELFQGENINYLTFTNYQDGGDLFFIVPTDAEASTTASSSSPTRVRRSITDVSGNPITEDNEYSGFYAPGIDDLKEGGFIVADENGRLYIESEDHVGGEAHYTVHYRIKPTKITKVSSAGNEIKEGDTVILELNSDSLASQKKYIGREKRYRRQNGSAYLVSKNLAIRFMVEISKDLSGQDRVVFRAKDEVTILTIAEKENLGSNTKTHALKLKISNNADNSEKFTFSQKTKESNVLPDSSKDFNKNKEIAAGVALATAILVKAAGGGYIWVKKRRSRIGSNSNCPSFQTQFRRAIPSVSEGGEDTLFLREVPPVPRRSGERQQLLKGVVRRTYQSQSQYNPNSEIGRAHV